jgi:hypothetical protein
VSDEQRHPGGRPTKYDPAYCEEMIDFMGQGYSLTAWAGQIGVSRATVNNWAEANPEFLEALHVAKAKRLMFWEQTAINVAAKGTGGPGAASVITFGLKNMGGDEWSDTTKTELTGKDGAPLPVTPAVAIYTLPDNGRG